MGTAVSQVLASLESCFYVRSTARMNGLQANRVCGGITGSVGVKWVQLFLKYLHPWSPVFMCDPLPGCRQGD